MILHLRKLFSALVLFTLLLAACRPAPPPTATGVSPTTAATTAPGGTPQPRTATPTVQGRSADIQAIQGAAEKRADAQAAWDGAAIGDALAAGNQVRTGADSVATLHFSEGTLVRVAPDSLFTMTEIGGDAQNPVTKLELAVGKLFVMLFGSAGEGEFEIETPTGVASVRGSLMSVHVTDDGRIIVTCLETEGGCELKNDSGIVKLESGQQAEIVGAGEPPSPAEKIDDSEVNDWFQNNPEAQIIVTEDADGDTYTVLAGDCDDDDSAIHPGADDPANDGLDQNCDSQDGVQTDEDGDGFTVFDGDCDDQTPAVHPSADDPPRDGVDQNCDGEDGVSDHDGDEIPDEFDLCPFEPGLPEKFGCPIGQGGDDADKDGVPDELDQCRDAPGLPDNGGCPTGRGHDADGDGFAPEFGDCNDEDPTIHPYADDPVEDGIDQNCDGEDGDIGGGETSDRDWDNVPDHFDNCPFVYNPEQRDSDGNGIGDACDRGDEEADADRDEAPDHQDNCPFDFNPDQTDSNGNGVGDACDQGGGGGSDRDGDGKDDAVDNCPDAFNPDQRDSDGDGIGDACDQGGGSDRDSDGKDDVVDNCPDTSNPDQRDSDGDGIGDVCDQGGGSDRDGDGKDDAVDNCPDAPNPDQRDSDGDGIGDACDGDVDGDGHDNGFDNCPDTFNPDQRDSDGDGIGDLCDPTPFPPAAARDGAPPAAALSHRTAAEQRLPPPGLRQRWRARPD